MAETAHPRQSFNTLPPLSTMTQGMPLHSDSHKQTQNDYEVRDSGNWSMPSKHSSTVSSNPGIHHLLNPDESPRSRLSEASRRNTSSYASSAGPQTLPHLNQGYRRESVDPNPGTFLDSRRSSVDSSRMSMNMNQLALNQPRSPYESTNVSSTSLVSTLQRERGIPMPNLSRLSGGSNPMSPPDGRPSTARPIRRQAPPIAPPGSRAGPMSNPTASTPTKGQAWAFPDQPGDDDDDDMGMSSPRSSRQGSFASHEIGPYSSLQPRSVTSLASGDTTTGGMGNYSRTPELRVSHKLAERKRRSEMKDLFDQLNTILPNSPGNKSSKWEVLTKAIDYIQQIQGSMQQRTAEVERLREQDQLFQKAAEDNRAMESEVAAMYQQLCRLDPHNPHTYGPRTHAMEQQRSSASRLPSMSQPSQQQQTPPTVNGQNQWGQSGAMTGVEYGGPYDRR